MKDNNRLTSSLFSISMASTSGTVMTRAAAHLNDMNQLVYTSDVLLPMLGMALDELEEELAVYELTPLRRDSIPIDVPAGSTTLPQMPVDFVESVRLLERALDSSDRWREVREVNIVDANLTTSSEILQWTVRLNEIFINPPTSDREVLLEYVGGLAAAANDATAVDIESSRRFLALVTARNTARDLGNAPTKAATYDTDIGRARDRLVRRLQKNAQTSLGVRRLPYTGRR